MYEMSNFYIKNGDFYLQHYNFSDTGDVYYTMNKNYELKFTTNDKELIELINDTIRGTIYSEHACDVKCN